MKISWNSSQDQREEPPFGWKTKPMMILGYRKVIMAMVKFADF